MKDVSMIPVILACICVPMLSTLIIYSLIFEHFKIFYKYIN